MAPCIENCRTLKCFCVNRKPVKSAPYSAIRDHSSHGRPFDEINFCIMCSAVDNYELGIFEGLCIIKEQT